MNPSLPKSNNSNSYPNPPKPPHPTNAPTPKQPLPAKNSTSFSAAEMLDLILMRSYRISISLWPSPPQNLLSDPSVKREPLTMRPLSAFRSTMKVRSETQKSSTSNYRPALLLKVLSIRSIRPLRPDQLSCPSIPTCQSQSPKWRKSAAAH